MHIPKCAGTTIDHIFAKLSSILQNFEFKRYKYNQKNNIKKISKNFIKPQFISGHLPYNFCEHIDDLFLTTIVREPKSRITSNYKFVLSRLNKNPSQYPFKEFIKDEVNKNRDNLILRHFTGSLNENRAMSKYDLDNAIKNIKLFDQINLIENWDDFLSQLLTRFSLPSILYSKYQKHNYSFSFIPNNNDLELINKFFEYDFEIYSKISSKIKKTKTNNNKYNKNICIVSPFFENEKRLFNEEEVKKLFKK